MKTVKKTGGNGNENKKKAAMIGGGVLILAIVVFIILIITGKISFFSIPKPGPRQYIDHVYGQIQPRLGHPDAYLAGLNRINSGPGVRFLTNFTSGLPSDQGRLDYPELAKQLYGLSDKESEKFFDYGYGYEQYYPASMVNSQTPYNPLSYNTGALNTV